MNKAQLIDLLARRMDGDKRAASVAVEGVVDIVVRTVQAGENVTITGFGVFEKRSRAARVARNPRTGQTVHVAPTSVPSFRPGTTFKAVVSGAAELPADAPAVKRSAATRTTAAAKAPATKASARKAPAKKAAVTKAAAKKAPAKKAPAKNAPAKKAAVTASTATSAPKTAAAKTAAKAAAASAPPKAPKVEKPAKGKKVDDKKKKAKAKK